MICAIISLSFSLMFLFMGLIFQLAILIIQAFFVVVFEVVPLVVEAIFSFIGACFGSVSVSACNSNSVVTNKNKVKSRPVKSRSVKLSNRERKAIEKNIRREINKARDDIEYDMLMMMEVCADD